MLPGLSAKQSPSSMLKISNLIDWIPIRSKLDEMYDSKSKKGGRPHCDVILMFKIQFGNSRNTWINTSDTH